MPKLFHYEEPKAQKFFLNFGGPGRNTSSDAEAIIKYDELCRREYTGPVRAVNLIIHGINVKVLTYGIHRALLLEIPADASTETKRKYSNARGEAEAFSQRGYSLLGCNCVTSVATVLSSLDKNTTSAQVVYPWSLDSQLSNYCGTYRADSTEELFINSYQDKLNNENFSMFRSSRWSKHRIESVTDIIAHGYGRKEGSGERTQSTLIDLGWVIKVRSGLLTPTAGAPDDFSKGLLAYNEDFTKVEKLKKLYSKEAGIFSLNKYRFFADNPNYETALQRLKDQAVKNPNGASAKTLNTLEGVGREIDQMPSSLTTAYKEQMKELRIEQPVKETHTSSLVAKAESLQDETSHQPSLR